MKKFLLTLGVAAVTLASSASTRVLYKQNFENVADAAAAGWSFEGASISIASDNESKYLEIALGQNNGRSAVVTWGQDIFYNADGSLKLEDGEYTMKYDFNIKVGSNNQYNGGITVFTNHAPVKNQPYRYPWSPAGYWQNYIFDMAQVNGQATQYVVNGGTIETVDAEAGTTSYSIDYDGAVTFDPGMWYTVTLTANVESREVSYKVESIVGDLMASGTLEVPETNIAEVPAEGADKTPISMLAEGLYIMCARYQTTILIDNIKLTYESEFDFAEDPEIALTRFGVTADEELNLNLRGYTIKFNEGETLHFTGTDGKTVEVAYDECEGSYAYETTTSGVIKAYTTSGTATSETVEIEVDCTPYALPGAEATISAVEEGFAKTYTLTVNNLDVPLRPNVFIAYTFTGKDGSVISDKDLASGCKVPVSGEGTLSITTSAYGYQATTVNVENDIEFATKKVWDFARLTKEEIDAALPGAAWSVQNTGATSGFSNWTGRKRLYYVVEGSEHENDEGAIVMDNEYPFGFISEEDTEHVLEYAVLSRTDDAEYDSSSYFEGLTIFPDKGKLSTGLPNVGVIYHVGLYNDQTNNNNNNVIVNGLEATDFVVVNYINNYGGNSNHPICATTAEYYAQLAGEDAVLRAADGEATDAGLYNVTHPLYRVDTAITKVTVFEQKGSDAVEAIATEVAGDNYYYTIDGLRLAEPTRPGLYIHNGKKIIVK